MKEDTTKQAVLVRHYRPSGKLGDAALYWLNPPLISDHWEPDGEPFDYVVLSTRDGLTQMFPADNDGSVLGWSDITTEDWGPERIRTHESLLAAEGYRITEWKEVTA
jgi:hypothetical protein